MMDHEVFVLPTLHRRTVYCDTSYIWSGERSHCIQTTPGFTCKRTETHVFRRIRVWMSFHTCPNEAQETKADLFKVDQTALVCERTKIYDTDLQVSNSNASHQFTQLSVKLQEAPGGASSSTSKFTDERLRRTTSCFCTYIQSSCSSQRPLRGPRVSSACRRPFSHGSVSPAATFSHKGSKHKQPLAVSQSEGSEESSSVLHTRGEQTQGECKRAPTHCWVNTAGPSEKKKKKSPGEESDLADWCRDGHWGTGGSFYLFVPF